MKIVCETSNDLLFVAKSKGHWTQTFPFNAAGQERFGRFGFTEKKPTVKCSYPHESKRDQKQAPIGATISDNIPELMSLM
jgi:hypothetical protein